MNKFIDTAIKTMSTVEIAQLTGKRHDNVMRKAKELAAKGIIRAPQTEERYGNNNLRSVYYLDKIESLNLVANLSPEFTAKIIDRWQELENQQVQPRLSTVADRVPLKDAVNLLVARAGISYSDAYRMVHQRFAVDSVEELTLEQLPQAVEYVHKLVLSGELLPREEAPQEDIRSHQVCAIALMHTGWRRFEEQQRATRQLQGSIGAALGALDVAKAHLQAAFGDADAILHGSGAIWDGLHEALFHLHLPVDVMKEGRQRAETNYSPRILA